MIDETLCWTLYQIRNWSNWGRPMRFAITILPMVVYLIVGWKSFRVKEGVRRYITWRDLRWFLIMLIPWAVSEFFGIAYYTLCYSP